MIAPDLSRTEWIAQGLGLIGFAIAMSRFFAHDLRKIRALSILSQVFWVAHFLTLGRPMAAGMSGVAAARSSVLMTPLGWRHRPQVAMVAAAFVVVNAVMQWTDLTPILLLAMIAGITADIQPNQRDYRWWFLSCDFSWLIHNVLVGSWGGTATSFTLMAVNAVQLWRTRSVVTS